MKQNEGVALQMPSSYVEMSEEEMCYTEGGYVVQTHEWTRSTCSSFYSYICKSGTFQLVASSLVGSTLGTMICAGLGVASGGSTLAVGCATGLALTLSDAFGWYSNMKNTMASAASKNGARILFYSNGEITVLAK